MSSMSISSSVNNGSTRVFVSIGNDFAEAILIPIIIYVSSAINHPMVSFIYLASTFGSICIHICLVLSIISSVLNCYIRD